MVMLVISGVVEDLVELLKRLGTPTRRRRAARLPPWIAWTSMSLAVATAFHEHRASAVSSGHSSSIQ